ncbi:hypothetical protein P3W45_000141 [Vairimorpha bombi]|jgi:hypothetical protein
MPEVEDRVYNVVRKSTIFTSIANLIDEEALKEVATNVEKILSFSNHEFDIKQDNVAVYLQDFLDNKNIEIEPSDAESFANVLVWVHEESLMNEDVMYNKIMNIKSPDSSYEYISSDDECDKIEH